MKISPAIGATHKRVSRVVLTKHVLVLVRECDRQRYPEQWPLSSLRTAPAIRRTNTIKQQHADPLHTHLPNFNNLHLAALRSPENQQHFC